MIRLVFSFLCYIFIFLLFNLYTAYYYFDNIIILFGIYHTYNINYIIIYVNNIIYYYNIDIIIIYHTTPSACEAVAHLSQETSIKKL